MILASPGGMATSGFTLRRFGVRWIVALACASAAFFLQTKVHASENSHFVKRPVLLEAQVGYRAPLGGLGLAFDYSAARWLSTSTGMGLGYRGSQLAVAVRPRLAALSHAATAELGWSGGKFQDEPCFDFGGCEHHESRVWDFAHFLNLAAGYEYRAPRGFSLRTFLGLGFILNRETRCAGQYCKSWRSFTFGGVALGYAFEE